MLRSYFADAKLVGMVSVEDFKKHLMIKQAIENQKSAPIDRKKSTGTTSRSTKKLLTIKRDAVSPE